MAINLPLPSSLCPINDYCCINITTGNPFCGDPNIICKKLSGECVTKLTCDSCTEELIDCICVLKNNGCNVGIGEHPCGSGCCNSSQTCDVLCNCITIYDP